MGGMAAGFGMPGLGAAAVAAGGSENAVQVDGRPATVADLYYIRLIQEVSRDGASVLLVRLLMCLLVRMLVLVLVLV